MQGRDFSEVLSDAIRKKIVKGEDGFVNPSFEFSIYLPKSYVRVGLTKDRINDLLKDIEARTEKNYNIVMNIDILSIIANVIEVEIEVISYGLRG